MSWTACSHTAGRVLLPAPGFPVTTGGMIESPLVRFLVLAIFAAIVVSLGTALFALFKDSGNSDRAVKALTIRVGLSVGLFLLLLVLTALGVISPR